MLTLLRLFRRISILHRLLLPTMSWAVSPLRVRSPLPRLHPVSTLAASPYRRPCLSLLILRPQCLSLSPPSGCLRLRTMLSTLALSSVYWTTPLYTIALVISEHPLYAIPTDLDTGQNNPNNLEISTVEDIELTFMWDSFDYGPHFPMPVSIPS